MSNPVRVNNPLLGPEPDLAALAQRVITTADPHADAQLSVALERIYLIIDAQVERWFEGLGDPTSAASFRSLLSDGAGDRAMWDFLTGTPSKIAVHNALAEMLDSESLFRNLLDAANTGAWR